MADDGARLHRRYRCARLTAPRRQFGGMRDPVWTNAAWSEPFVDMETGAAAPERYLTRSKMLWDPRGLYVALCLAESQVQARVTQGGPHILQDNTCELLLDPDGDGEHYYELLINALGTRWELALDKPYQCGGTPDTRAQVAGLRSDVRVDGVVNDTTQTDRGWIVELALPWSGLAPFHRQGGCPPRVGDVWRLNLARLQWQGKVKRYYAWRAPGERNLHLPSRFGELVFVDAPGA